MDAGNLNVSYFQISIASRYGLPGMRARVLHTTTSNFFENEFQTQKVERLEKSM